MTITQTITELPDAPDPATDSADEFSDKAAAFVLGQKNMSVELGAFVPQVNSTMSDMNNAAAAAAASQAAAATAKSAAEAAAASAIASPSTNGTSTTSLTLGAGSQSLTTQTGKNWAQGMWINCVRTSDRSKSMAGYIDSYNSGTGALVLIVVAANVAGSGTFTDWTLTVAGLPGSIFNLVDLTLLGPSIRPSLLNDFANAKRLDARFVYTMTSPLSYYDAAGILREAAAGVPAFDHDPATGRCLGLSMWEARANLLLRSAEFDNASWLKGQASVTANGSSSPDGMMSMDKLVENTATNVSHIVAQARTASNETVTFSVFAKAAERTKVMLEMSNNVSYSVNAIFDLTAGLITSISSANADYSNISASIKNIGGGIYRCMFTCTKGSVNTTNSAGVILVNAAGNNIYTGDGTSGLYIWGAQLEVGPFATPYIPTTSATVTRNAATLTMMTSQFDFNANEGTLMAAYTKGGTLTVGSVVTLKNGSGTDYVILRDGSALGGTPGSSDMIVYAGGVSQADTNGFVTSDGVQHISVGAYKANDFVFTADGNSVHVDTSGTAPTMDRIEIGNPFCGWISKVAYYPKRLSNNELVALSTL